VVGIISNVGSARTIANPDLRFVPALGTAQARHLDPLALENARQRPQEGRPGPKESPRKVVLAVIAALTGEPVAPNRLVARQVGNALAPAFDAITDEALTPLRIKLPYAVDRSWLAPA
jgi:hypothetical protein